VRIDRIALLERIGLALGRVGLSPPALPLPFYDGYLGPLAARAVMAATRLGVIAALAEQPSDAGGLARRLGLDEERLEVLLAALTSLGYIRRRRDGRWAPTRMARRWLGPDGVDAMVGHLAYEAWDRLSALEEVLAGAEPTGWHEAGPEDRLWVGYQRGMAQLEAMTAKDLAAAIPVELPSTLLDVGGGPGLHAAEMCRRHPGLQATVVDLEGAARHATPREGVRFVAANFFEADLGSDFDVATVHSVLHNFPPDRCRLLLERVREALRPGGLLAVQELERGPVGRAAPLPSSLGSLLFLTAMGSRTYTAPELSAMARDAGFVAEHVLRPVRLPGSLILLARRP